MGEAPFLPTSHFIGGCFRSRPRGQESGRGEEFCMNFGLQGKTALVLAGGGGLGRAIAKSLAGEGANVAVAGRGDSIAGTQAALAEIGVKSMGLVWDLADLTQIDANVAKIEKELGPVDILVNNTGGPPPTTARGQKTALRGE